DMSRSRRRCRRRAATTRGVRAVNGATPGCMRVAVWSGGLCGPAADALGAHRRARNLDEAGEGRGVVDRHIGEDLGVHLDAPEAQALNEAVVRHAVRTSAGIDSRDPQLAEVALAVTAVTVRVLHRVQHLLLRLAVQAGALATVAAGTFQDGPALLLGV